jgi:molybdopterin-guanine dinucleotide biosynthesis protein A
VILAGGLGRRIGGAKAVVQLGGRPLISYPLQALQAALGEVAIVAKPDTELPRLPGAVVWIESEPTRHPLVGLVQALGLAEGRAVLACAADLPFVTPALVRRLARPDSDGAAVVVASYRGDMQPLLGCYQPSTLEPLSRAVLGGGLPVREAVAALAPRLLEVKDPELLFNVNAPDDLAVAAAMLDRRRSANQT